MTGDHSRAVIQRELQHLSYTHLEVICVPHCDIARLNGGERVVWRVSKGLSVNFGPGVEHLANTASLVSNPPTVKVQPKSSSGGRVNPRSQSLAAVPFLLHIITF
jgi:hypothetical protein